MIKNDLTDALALWGIGRSVANAMGVKYALRYAENGITSPFVRQWFMHGVMNKPSPTQEAFDV